MSKRPNPSSSAALPPAKKLHQSTLSFGSKPLAKPPSSPASHPPPSTLKLEQAKPSEPYDGSPESVITKLFPSLPEEKHKLVQLEVETMGRDWLDALKPIIGGQPFLGLKTFVQDEIAKSKVYPPPEDVYSFTRFSRLQDVRLVIIGQDPYHQPKQAHGLSFSVRKGIVVPPSLRNIYKEIKDEYPDFKIPSHGDLSSWASQGVLLLNTSLTVRASEAGSHSKAGWEPFTKAIIKELAKREPGKVFMCWGKHAEKMVDSSGVDQKKHLVLRSVHPSPLSAHRGFFGTGHFKRADDWLEERWGPGGGIDWTSVSK